MKKILFGLVLGAVVSIGLLSCTPKSKDKKEKSKELEEITTNFYEQYLQFHPLEATSQGDERYNAQLPIDISPEFIQKEKDFYTKTEKQLLKINYKILSDEDKVVLDVLQFKLKDHLEGLDFHFELIPFNQFDGLPLQFPLLGSGEGSQPFKTVKNYEDWLRRMEQFPAWMAQAKKNFQLGIESEIVLPKVLVKKMITQMNAEELISKENDKNIFLGPIKKIPKEFSEAQKQILTKKYQESVSKNIIPTYLAMGKFLAQEYLPKAQEKDGVNALPNGEARYQYLVKSNTTTEKSPEDIFQIGKTQVEIIRAEMLKVKNEMGFQGSLYDFIYTVAKDPKATPYHTKQEVLDEFQKILTKITPKLKTYFNVTPISSFEIRPTEKFREATASAEYVPGTPDGKRPGIFYIPLPEPSKFNITSGMESLFLHEAIPGHHYQISLQQENMSLPKFMRFGWINAYGEGWAHYCETLGPEFGLYKDAYQKMGFLNDQMLRAVRLVVDTGLHTGMMDREVAISYYLNNIADNKANATSAIERYMAIPGQALGYKIGALKIIELREKYTKELGNKFNIAKFHDEILSQGCLPLDVLDKKMALWAKKQ
jgi:uncharacterized protein (DUF885 family)